MSPMKSFPITHCFLTRNFHFLSKIKKIVPTPLVKLTSITILFLFSILTPKGTVGRFVFRVKTIFLKKQMEQINTLPNTSPPPKTAISMLSGFDSMYEEGSPCKRAKICEYDEKMDENMSLTVKLILRNGVMIVERSLLAYYSNYFRCLFSSSFIDSNSSEHRLRIVNSSDLHFLLTIPRVFENNVKPEMSLQRAIELLEPAAYLQIDIALNFITEVITKHLNHENIIRLFRLSLLYHIPLAQKIWRCMVSTFQTLYQTKDYLKLNESELMALLSEKKLNIKCEDESKLVYSWIEHNKYSKTERLKKYAEANFKRKPMPDSTYYEVIRNRQPVLGLMTHGGWASRRNSQIIEIFNTRTERWQKCNVKFDIPTIVRAYHAVDIIDDTLMVYGGFTGFGGFKSTILLDLKTKEWKNGKNMKAKRCYISSAKIKDSHGKQWVYACGGYNGLYRLRSCEVYDFHNDQWKRIANMNMARSDGWTCSIGQKLLTIGGFDGDVVHQTAEIYDPIVDVWTPVSKMRTRRTGLSAVGINDQVAVVCGGFTGSKRLDSCELYDVREGKWHALPNMHTGRSNFATSFVDNTTIYAAGGFDGVSTTKQNERMDLRMRTWQALPDMWENKSALRLIQLKDHPFLDELFEIPDDLGIVETW